MMAPLKTLTSLVVLLCIGGGSGTSDDYGEENFRVCEELRELYDTCDFQPKNKTEDSTTEDKTEESTTEPITHRPNITGACGTDNTPKCSCTQFGFGPDDGPDKWGDFCPACKGEDQSPIDIGCDTVSHQWTRENELIKHMEDEYRFRLRNEGYTVTMRLLGDPKLRVWDGGLTQRYYLHHMQLFWGANDSVGSHHTMRGQSFAMEVQFTFINVQFIDYEEAAASGEYGMVILSYLLKLAKEDNPTIQAIVDLLPKVLEPGQEAVSEQTITLEYLIRTRHPQDYYAYPGSLTTPPCTGTYTWHVIDSVYGVSSKQVAEFRKLHSPVGLQLTNIRPVQRKSKYQTIMYSYKGYGNDCHFYRASQNHHVKSSKHRGVSRHHT